MLNYQRVIILMWLEDGFVQHGGLGKMSGVAGGTGFGFAALYFFAIKIGDQ
jgi:hypothetical protein